jgi:hypothetical protein
VTVLCADTVAAGSRMEAPANIDAAQRFRTFFIGKTSPQ